MASLVLAICSILALALVGCDDGSTAPSAAGTSALDSSVTTVIEGVTPPPSGPGSWSDLAPSGEAPAPRDSHSMVYDPALGKVILFGGWGGDESYFADTWLYDPAANVWTELSPAGVVPSRRAFHQMVYDPDTGEVLLFGGSRNEEEFLNDTWLYDPVANVWTELIPEDVVPPARMDHAMVYDPAGHRLIMFGGWSGDTAFNDTWAYDPAANTWTDLDPAGDLPPARDSHAMVYDPDTGTIILFGGFTEEVMGDTWQYDPAANRWTELEPAGATPAPRDRHRMVYDPIRRQVLLFGGWLGDFCADDTWAYDPATDEWRQLDPAGDRPSKRDSYSLVYDATTGAAILFGGVEPIAWTRFGDTWSYGD